MIIIPAILFAGIIIGYTNVAIASNSPYPGREYMYDQWFQVYVKVGNTPVQVGNNPAGVIDTNWRQVYALPGSMAQGYTADLAGNVETNTMLAHYLKTAGMYDEVNNIYLFSRAGAQSIGKGSPYVQGSEWVNNIPIKSTSNDSEVSAIYGFVPPKHPEATGAKPRIAYNDFPGSVVWDGSKFHYAISTGQIDGAKRGIINLQEENKAHRAFATAKHPYVGYGGLRLYFPYDTRFVESTPVHTSQIVTGQKAYGYINVVNLSPWTTVASSTKFRLYIKEKGKSTVMAAEPQLLAINPISGKQVGFEYSVPDGEFTLILTTNMYWQNGWVNEPLTTFNINNVVVVNPEQEYARNKVEVTIIPNSPHVAPPPAILPSNLNVVSVVLVDLDNKPVIGTVKLNEGYKVKINYGSTFNIGGHAKSRLYLKDKHGIQLREVKDVYFQPYGYATHIWDWPGTNDEVAFIATISYQWDDTQAVWVEEQFEGQTETTYEDNMGELIVTGTYDVNVPPTPGKNMFPLYYHPFVEIWEPIYETVTVENVVTEWVEVEGTPPKTGIRLVR